MPPNLGFTFRTSAFLPWSSVQRFLQFLQPVTPPPDVQHHAPVQQAAQYRGRLFATLIDQQKMGSIGSPGFELFQAQNAFQQLVGPYINGYAFGDIDQLIPIIEKVQREGRAVPDLTKIYPNVIFKPRSEWHAGNEGLNEGLTKLVVTLKNEKASIRQQRIERGMEAKFSKLPNKAMLKGIEP